MSVLKYTTHAGREIQIPMKKPLPSAIIEMVELKAEDPRTFVRRCYAVTLAGLCCDCNEHLIGTILYLSMN